MEPLIIEEVENVNPKIILNKEKGEFEISGRSHPEDANSCYAPVFNWINKYAENPNPETIFHFRLQYYNTSSAKQIFRLISLLEDIQKKKKIKIQWHSPNGDLDMLESGRKFSKMSTIPFEFVAC